MNQASKNLTREQIELVFQVGAPQVFSIIQQFVFRDLTPTKMENWVEQSSKGWWKVESDFPSLDSTWCYTVTIVIQFLIGRNCLQLSIDLDCIQFINQTFSDSPSGIHFHIFPIQSSSSFLQPMEVLCDFSFLKV